MPGTGVPYVPEQNDVEIHWAFSSVPLTYSEHMDNLELAFSYPLVELTNNSDHLKISL